MPRRIWNSSPTWPEYMTEGQKTLQKFVPTSGSCILVCQVSKWFRIAIIRVIFSCLYCRTIDISLIILLASQVNYLEVRTYFLQTKSLFNFSCCFLFLIDSITEYKKRNYFLSLLKVDHRHAMFLNSPFKSCYQSLLTGGFDYLECKPYCQRHDNQRWIYWRANGAEMFHNHNSV